MKFEVTYTSIMELQRLTAYFDARGDAVKVEHKWNHCLQRYVDTMHVQGIEFR